MPILAVLMGEQFYPKMAAEGLETVINRAVKNAKFPVMTLNFNG